MAMDCLEISYNEIKARSRNKVSLSVLEFYLRKVNYNKRLDRKRLE